MTMPDPTTGAPPVAPIPALPLTYSIYAGRMRPGVLTAIGVLCIVVASLSAVASLVTGMYGLGGYMMSRFSGRVAMTPVPVASVSASPNAKPSLSPADASVATNALTAKLSLRGPQVRELNNLFRNNGREVLGGDEDVAVSSPFVVDQVSNVQHAADGSVSFDTAQGHVDLRADHARFVSADGSETIDLSAANGTNSSSQSAAAVASSAGSPRNGSALTPAEINKALTSAQQDIARFSSTPLNAAQLAALRSALSAPNQQLVTPGTSLPVIGASPQFNGQVTITFDTGSMLTLGPAGQVVSSGPPPMPKVSSVTAVTLMLEAAGSILLAIYLLIVGILVFRSYSRTPRLLNVFAVLKIPLAIAAGVGIIRFGYELSSSSPALGAMAWGFVMWGSILSVLGLAFPIGLLITLRTRTVRDYFNAVVDG